MNGTSKCQNNLEQIGLAVHNYHDSMNKLPVFSYAPNGHSEGGDFSPSVLPPEAGTKKHFSGFILILPFIEQDAYARLYNRSFGYDDDTTPGTPGGPTNRSLTSKPFPAYLCHSMPTPTAPCYNSYSSYAASRGNFEYLFNGATIVVNSSGKPRWTADDGMFISAFNPPPATNGTASGSLRYIGFAAVSDGLSNTFLVGEKHYTIEGSTWSSGTNVHSGAMLGGQTFAGNTNYVFPHPGADANDGTTNSKMNSKVVLNTAASWSAKAGNVTSTAADPASLNVNGPDAWFRNTALGAFRSVHNGGCNFVFGDGSVKFVRDSIDADTYRGLGSRAGGEVLGEY